MLAQPITVGTAAVQIPVGNLGPNQYPSNIMKFAARAANSGTVYFGVSSSVATSGTAQGVLLSQAGSAAGTPNAPAYFQTSVQPLWLVASAASQVVDVVAY
jgi:hypothetical protein